MMNLSSSVQDWTSLTTNAVDFATFNGIIMRPKNQGVCHLPFTLFPTPVPKECFEKLLALQPHVNMLAYKASQDDKFLISSLKSVVEVDDFTRKLFEIYEAAKTCSTRSKFELGIFRSDYMFNACKVGTGNHSSSIPKQIELNTMAASFGGIGGHSVKSLHSRVLLECKQEEKLQYLPENHSRNQMSRGLVSAWTAYGNVNAIIVFLVFPCESNIFDQRMLEYEIYSINQKICIKRKTFEDIIHQRKVSDDGRLFIDDNEVAVVYFRCGYGPSDYLSQQYWDARLMLEKTCAIKCPSVALQLVGCKKMQEVFAKAGSVERFIHDSEAVKGLRETFAGLYHLEMNSEGDAAVKMAMSNPDDYVLKPQREGGGNNIYGEDMVRTLLEIGSDTRRCAYILMDKIKSRTNKNVFVRQEKFAEVETLSEFGVFGVILAKGNKVIENYTAGHLLRSKSKDQEDGGVAAGVAVMDSPLLV